MQLEVGIQLDIEDIIHYAFDKAFSAKDSQLVSKFKVSKLEHLKSLLLFLQLLFII